MNTFDIVNNLYETFMPSFDEGKKWNRKKWRFRAIELMNIIIGMTLANQATAEQIKAIKEKMEKG